MNLDLRCIGTAHDAEATRPYIDLRDPDRELCRDCYVQEARSRAIELLKLLERVERYGVALTVRATFGVGERDDIGETWLDVFDAAKRGGVLR